MDKIQNIDHGAEKPSLSKKSFGSRKGKKNIALMPHDDLLGERGGD